MPSNSYLDYFLGMRLHSPDFCGRKFPEKGGLWMTLPEEEEFNREMFTICDAREIDCKGYNPTYLRWAINEYGGVGAAYHILSLPGETSSGLKKLKKCGHLELSVQAIILKPKYASLFKEKALQEAHDTLCLHGYHAPWDERPC